MAKIKKKIGCLGFSANPPHFGHLEMARLILDKKLADEVWLIPCFRHPFDKDLAPANHRWRMAKLLEEKNIKAKDIEIKHRKKNYTITTAIRLKREYPNYEFLWIVGSDIVKTKSYKKWKKWDRLVSLIKFLVIERPGYKIKKLPPGLFIVGKTRSRVSSTDIRNKIKNGLSIKNLVPEKIIKYIQKYNLYK